MPHAVKPRAVKPNASPPSGLRRVSRFSPAKQMARHAEEASALLKALAHPARLRVLCQLMEGEASVGALQPLTGLGLSALSQHLAVLRDMGLVDTRRDAQTILYSIVDGPALPILAALHAVYCGRGK